MSKSKITKNLPPVVVVSIPKSGTHLLLNLLNVLGYQLGGPLPQNPKAGHWYSAFSDHTHATYEWLLGLQPYHSISQLPILFSYRNPLDILVSEANYVHLDGKTSFWSYYAGMSEEERIIDLIDNPWTLKSIRERIGAYLGWLELRNVIPLSFEEMIGSQGGGCDIIQMDAVDSILKKLEINVSAPEICGRLFDNHSPTFRKGKIGSYKEVFSDRCYLKFSEQQQDFMALMGYTPIRVREEGGGAEEEMKFSRRINEFRKRSLMLSKENVSSTPYLIATNIFEHNIVIYRRRYYAIPQSSGPTDLTKMNDTELNTLLSDEDKESLFIKMACNLKSQRRRLFSWAMLTGKRL